MLVDDHAILRRGLRELLGDELHDAEFVEVSTGEAAIAEIDDKHWDLIVLDLALPGRGGLEALRDIHARRPEIPVIVFSASEDEHYAVRALRAGAKAYVTKQSAPTELLRAAHKVVTGSRYLSSGMAERIAESAVAGQPIPHQELSDREMQVLRMIAQGKTLRDIAAELALSEKTISTYRARVLQKMKLTSNAELMRYALRAGLVD